MVDWDRVQDLRSKGWDWADIAKDPKVDFHPDASAGSPGRALRALYHRTGRRLQEAKTQETPPKRLRKEEEASKWTLMRYGWLLVPLVAVWFALAYLAPSPVGLLLPAIPYLALILAGVALVLIYAIWRRTEGPRWSAVYRKTVVTGVVVGLVVSGGIGLAGTLIFGCPYLPPSSSLSGFGGQGWEAVPTGSWQSSGVPVVFYFGATWCPYCSASSWAIYKALTEFASVSNVGTAWSSQADRFPGTPEMNLAGTTLGPKNAHVPPTPPISLQVAEDTSGVDGTIPPTANCYQAAYVSAYAGGIPFFVINGQVLHAGALVNPLDLTTWNLANGTAGATTVQNSVLSETGTPWTDVEQAAWLFMAFIAKYLGWNVNNIATYGGPSEYAWSSSTLTAVTTDLSTIT